MLLAVEVLEAIPCAFFSLSYVSAILFLNKYLWYLSLLLEMVKYFALA